VIDYQACQRIVQFCSEECVRQHSGERSVGFMFDAWIRMIQADPVISVETIMDIGKMVDPRINAKGFRRGRVWIGGEVRPVVDFERVLGALCESYYDHAQSQEDISDFFREFEKVHPFTDGNGRTGAILYNMMLRTMKEPQETPDLEDPKFFTRKSRLLSL
jgi:Fic/DOC family